MFTAIRLPSLSLAETSVVTSSNVRHHIPALPQSEVKAATHPSILGKNIPVGGKKKKKGKVLLNNICFYCHTI